jgi:hypothetical protein
LTEAVPAGIWEQSGRRPDSHRHDLSSDIFSIAKSVDTDPPDAQSSAFAAALEPGPQYSDADLLFSDVTAPEETSATPQPLSREQTQAIEHFESGLAFLQRSAFEDALRQFEIALQLDPQNRLCRANIQRIRDKLNLEA